MRCFVGIELDAVTRDALDDAGRAIRAASSQWAGEKWVRPENLHLTIAFLGNLDERVAKELADTVGARLAEECEFSLPFAGLKAVPKARRASMLWAGYRDTEGRGAALGQAVAESCAPFGIELEERMFRAHVTLVRARRPRRVPPELGPVLEAAREKLPAFMSVPSATLFSSTLTKTGPVYHPLAKWVFRPSELCE